VQGKDVIKRLTRVELLFFFAFPKKNQKRNPETDYTPVSGWFPD
jgi:hypothetical protein